MSDELTLTIRASFDKSGAEFSFPDQAAQEFSVDVSGSRFIHNRQQVGTSEEALALGDIATGGYLVAVNRDSTNFVEIRSGTGATDLVRLNAGEMACFRISSDTAAPYVIANTAAVELEYVLWQA